LLVHDLLVSKGGIALPATHGLRASIDRHKARLTAELTRSRVRRKAASADALREQIETAYAGTSFRYPRWIRVNTLLTTLEDQLETTFKGFTRAYSIADVTSSAGRSILIDEHVPNLVAVSPTFEVIKTDAYKSGAIILQDKASCFPAYLLDPCPADGDVIDSCAAPGNKTTHLASIVQSRTPETEQRKPKVFAFEKDRTRSKTLEKMVKIAGGKEIIRISFGQDFLKVDPEAGLFRDVGCLLLDPSCSGSGIVGRDNLPTMHLPEAGGPTPNKSNKDQSRKRKRAAEVTEPVKGQVLVDDDGEQTVVSSEQELNARLDALASFQLILLLHAFKFPSAKKITYSTCSVHAQENEQVVIKALDSEVAKARGWRILARDEQVRGMREWPVRGVDEAADGNKAVADACIRSYKDDGRGVMGFFVAAFVRDGQQYTADDDGPFLRDEDGRIIRDIVGMPLPKPTQAPALSADNTSSQQAGGSASVDVEDGGEEESASGSSSSPEEDNEWGGFDD
jgi:putative methyltransferase